MPPRRQEFDARLARGARRMAPGSLEGRSEQAQPQPNRPRAQPYRAPIETPSSSTIVVETQTGVAYTLALADAGKLLLRNNASANTTTIPPNSSVAFPVGTTLEVMQYGAGASSFIAGAGVTIRSNGGLLAIDGQYGGVALTKLGTNEWWIEGRLA